MRLSIKTLLSRQTSVRLNLSSNLISRVLAAVVNLACIPIYIRVLGVSGYGVIGIWFTLEALANLLDLGLSPTMTRELASTARSVEETQNVRDLVRTIEVICWIVGLFIGASIVLGAPLIATHWLQSGQLSEGELRGSVQLIGVLILCRWPLTFYASGLRGLERQFALSWIDFVLVVVRSLGAVAVLVFISPTIFAFLIWQIAIGIVSTGTVAASLWWALPKGGGPRFRPKLLMRVWKFAGGVAAIAVVSMLLNDLDKLVVSGLVSLEDFGYYTLASRMAGTVLMASSSVFPAVFPALVRLATEQNEAKFAELYHRGSQMMSLLVFPAAITAAVFAKPLIFAWTGSEQIATNTAPIAALLLIGNAFLCTAALPYAAQLAHGWTSLAFWTNLSYLPVTTVLLVMLTKRFGGEGAAVVWVLITASYFATQIPLMYRRLLRFQARQWYINDVGIPMVTCSLMAWLLTKVLGTATTRIGATLIIGSAGLLVGAVGLLVTPLVRSQLRDLWLQNRPRLLKLRR
jgi:O-antigen/teichoic acid export membrane protein